MKLNALDLNKLRIFWAVMEQKGYKGASEKLGLTRSALSQAITTFEAQIGRPLFHRSGTKLIPTEDANLFFEETRRYQDGLEIAFTKLHHRGSGLNGTLKIGAYLEFTKSKLMPIIENFLLENGDAQIQFHFDSPSRLESLLENGKIDLSISIYSQQGKGIQSQKLYEEELCLVGRKDLISQKPSAAELNQVSVIDYFPSHQLFKRWWTANFKNLPLRARTRVFAATSEVVLEMVERRLGIGVIPKYLLAGASSRIHIIEPTSKQLTDYLWINRRREKKRLVLEEVFLTALEQGLGKQ